MTRCVILSVCLSLASLLAEPALDVPMDNGLFTVLLRFGLDTGKPTSWEGTYRLNKGRIVATDGWRFMKDDYATIEKFKLDSRKFYPRFWYKYKKDPDKLRVEPNGVVLTIAGKTPESELVVTTNHGEFKVPVGKLGYSLPARTLNRQVEYQRLPTYRQILRSPTEDGYPSAVAGPDGSIAVAYVAFTHGKGFARRPPIKKAPSDFSFLAVPTGGDQVMLMELKGGRWTAPEALSPGKGDILGTAVARDGQDRLWVLWAENVQENWDIYGKVRTGGKWSGTLRISTNQGSDFGVRAATASDGRVWLTWQSLRQASSDVAACVQEGDGFSQPELVAESPSNDWSPAIAASKDGQVAVAWDTYEAGQYDVKVRIWKSGAWQPERLIAGSTRNEARPSVTFDSQNRLWIAYEDIQEGWGKDYGPYDRAPNRIALYRGRKVGVRVLQGNQLYQTAADVTQGLPTIRGGPRWPKSGPSANASGPAVIEDARGRIWLAVRNRVNGFDSQTGGAWLTFLTCLEGDKWRPSMMVPESDGYLHQTSTLLAAADGGLTVISSTDGRFRNAAFFGPDPWKRRRRSRKALPATTRKHAAYPDNQFNMELSLAQTGQLAAPSAGPKLVPVPAATAGVMPESARQEAAQVQAIRAYRAEIGGKALRILRGEFHRHTEFSSDGAGDGSIFDMWRYANDMAALDWIGNGDHDNGSREFPWWFTQKTTSIFQQPGRFTPMYTYERSCNYPDGHRNAMFARRGIRPLGRLRGGMGKAMDDLPVTAKRPNTPDTQMFYQYLRQFGGICASHTSGTDMGTDWRDNAADVEPVVEIYQGDRQNYERPGAPRTNTEDYSLGGWHPYGFVSYAFMKGIRLGFQSSSDHISTHMSYCNVWVEEQTRGAILDAMKRRRVYGATDNIIADVRCSGHFMGESFTLNKAPSISVKLIGTAPFKEVVIVKDNEYVYSTSPGKKVVEFEWTDNQAQPGKTSYYYVRGLQQGKTVERTIRSLKTKEKVKIPLDSGEIVWASPMWITYQP